MATFKDMTRYECEITQQGFCVSKNKGTDGFFIVFKPLLEIDREDPERTYACPEYERRMDMWLTENTIENHIKNWRKWGWNGTSFRDLDPETGSHSFVGTHIELLCKHEEYQGKTYDRWEVPYEGTMEAIASDSKVASKLDNLFGKKLRGPGPAKLEPKKSKLRDPEPVAVLNDEGNDEIPF